MDLRLEQLVAVVEHRLTAEPPHVVGIAGAVAVGKSTIARGLEAAFRGRGRRTTVVATDAFLLPNSVLAERDALYRKGFPETYDSDGAVAFVRGVRSKARGIRIPVYSHRVYDIVSDEWTDIPETDLILLEGVVALQPHLLEYLDAAIYIDAPEAAVRRWFADRFVTLTSEARSGADSFYRMFAQMTDDEVRAAAEGTWDAINGPNLHEHIEHTRPSAMVIVEKGSDHDIVAVREVS